MITEKHIVTITRNDKYFKALKNSCLEQGYKLVGENTVSETFEKSTTYRIVEDEGENLEDDKCWEDPRVA